MNVLSRIDSYSPCHCPFHPRTWNIYINNLSAHMEIRPSQNEKMNGIRKAVEISGFLIWNYMLHFTCTFHFKLVRRWMHKSIPWLAVERKIVIGILHRYYSQIFLLDGINLSHRGDIRCKVDAIFSFVMYLSLYISIILDYTLNS